MPSGVNKTGLPNVEDYVLGRGRVSFAIIDTDTGLPGPYRDLGNAPEFSMSIETEKIEHQSSRQGLKVVDKEVLVSQKINLALTLDEINFQNLALFLSGTATYPILGLGAAANAAGVTFASIPNTFVLGDIVGRWYDLIDQATGLRVYNIDAAAALGTVVGGGEIQLFVDAVEFTAGMYANTTLDRRHGRIFLSSDWPGGAGAPAAATAFTFVVKWPAAIVTGANSEVHEVKAATQVNIVGALKFISVNAASNNEETEYQFHKVSIKPQGDFSMIGDEFTRMQFTGAAESNVLADPDSPYVTIRRPTNQ